MLKFDFGGHLMVCLHVKFLARDCYYYRPQRSWGKVIFSQASVILLTGGGCLLLGGSGPRGVPAARGVPALGGCLLQGGSGLGGPSGDPLGRPLLRAVRILLECILVSIVIRMTGKMGPSLILPVFHTVTIGTILKNYGSNNGHGLKTSRAKTDLFILNISQKKKMHNLK